MRNALKVVLLATAFAVALPATALASAETLREFEDAFIRIGEEARPSVVNIDVEEKALDMQGRTPNRQQYEDLFRFFGIPMPDDRGPAPFGAPRRIPRATASGSGFIYDKQGHIITNNHLVENAAKVTVRLHDGAEYVATEVSTDPDTDLAVVKIDADRELKPVVLGDSDSLRVGQFAIAMGSPRGLEGSLSFGHISALGREGLRLEGLRFQNFIQTDAAINLGNSGGPLCNIDGEVIGINTAIVFGAESLGFAIPINTAKQIIPQLIAEGKVTRGYLGVEIKDASADSGAYAEALGLPDQDGAYVNKVYGGTPAERAGIKVYDVIRSVNGEMVKTASELVNKISEIAPGATVTLDVWRDKQPIQIDVKLDEYPGSMEKAELGQDVLGMRLRTINAAVIDQMGLDPGTKGLVITDVLPGSPAEEAGMMVGEVVIEIARRPVFTVSELRKVLQEEEAPGKPILVRVFTREGQENTRIIRIPEEDSGQQ
jgi:serine protease Do